MLNMLMVNEWASRMLLEVYMPMDALTFGDCCYFIYPQLKVAHKHVIWLVNLLWHIFVRLYLGPVN